MFESSRATMIPRRGIAAGVVGLVLVASCGDGATEPTEPPAPPPDAPRPTTVVVSPSTVALNALGATVRLTARVSDQNGREMREATVTWRSASPAVATVSATGSVTAVGRGMATITATAGGASGTAEVTVDDPDRAALVAFYNATDGPYWVDNRNWLTDAPLGAWYGVETDASGRVASLRLPGRFDFETQTWAPHGLKGTIPAELGGLAELRHLDLEINHLTGPVPPELGKLANLTQLELGNNSLEGPIPPELGELANLTRLFLHSNSLNGPIPPELAELVDLTHLSLGENRLSGRIPPELGGLASLRGLYLDWNDLSGPIPPELGNLAGLITLSLSRNGLSGPIPEELGNLANLVRLSLDANDLSGSIPGELGNLTDLTQLYLHTNDLSGTIPGELGNLTDLTTLILSVNDLSGPIPPELGGLANLTRLGLALTDLSGAIPGSFLALANLESLNLYQSEGLCAPATADFRDWLDGLEYQDTTYCSESDRAVLGMLYETAAGPGWTDAEGWLGGPVLGQWRGVRADSLGRVAALDLGGNGLSGRLPANLGQLERMTELRIGGNPALSGRLPSSLSRLSLAALDYAGTGLCAPPDASFREWLGTIPSHRGTGVECDPLSDRAVLEILHRATDGPNWIDDENWLTDAPLREWYGVEVDAAGRVVGLDLAGGWDHDVQARIRHGLDGPIPPELGELANLTRLSLGDNDLKGPIPPELAGLADLTYLDLGGNSLSGSVPPELGRLVSLTTLDLGGNSLSGRIPPELGGLASLTRLYLAANDLSGPIPAELGNLTNLEHLSFDWNDLSGPIPDQLGRLTSLTRLGLRGNDLTGAVPPELGRLGSLTTLDLGDNRLTGPIPPELGDLVQLTDLNLDANDLSGTIPPELGRLANLTDLNLSANDLSGAIPPQLGRLTRLTAMNFNGNVLSGAIPAELGSLADLRLLNLGSNRLTRAIPAELGGLGSLTRLYLAENELSGPVPPEFGGLAALRELVLSANRDLAGPLPTSLAALGNLELLSAGGTMLCAPSDAAFLRWLEAIPSRRVTRCAARQAAAYLVQAVQSREFPVPIVAGEEALLRVFPTAARAAGAAMPPIRARFYAGGSETYVENIPGKSAPIPTEVDEGSLVKSANAVIPGRVVQPGLEMVIEVDPDGTLDPGLGVTRRIPETGRMPVDVRVMPVLDLTVVPFLWTADPDSAVVDSVAVMASDPEGAELLWGARTLLPVGGLEVSAHEPVLSSSNNAFDLLAQTEALRVMEGEAGHYMGVLTGAVTGAGGVGYLSGRSTFVASGPNWYVIAHELGHNMSLGHAGCAPDNDPAYPHADGRTGAWGYDFRAGTPVPPTRRDVMSYCSGSSWISDYYFDKALRYRLADEGAPDAADMAATAALLLWGGVDAAGQPYLEPAFVLDAPPALPGSTGEYSIRGRTGEGAELFSIDFAMPQTGEESSSFAFALPVLSGWDRRLASITLSGPGGETVLDRDTDRPLAILRNPRTGQVRGFLRDPPFAAAGAAADAARRFGWPRLEMLQSRGIPGAAAWRR